MLLNNRNRIVSRDELMTDLWDNNEFVNDNQGGNSNSGNNEEESEVPVQVNFDKLKEAKKIVRIGSKKNGYWEVIE